MQIWGSVEQDIKILGHFYISRKCNLGQYQDLTLFSDHVTYNNEIIYLETM